MPGSMSRSTLELGVVMMKISNVVRVRTEREWTGTEGDRPCLFLQVSWSG